MSTRLIIVSIAFGLGFPLHSYAASNSTMEEQIRSDTEQKEFCAIKKKHKMRGNWRHCEKKLRGVDFEQGY